MGIPWEMIGDIMGDTSAASPTLGTLWPSGHV